ncbi:hypothetical protein [Porphyromonas levii]|uniref:plasmid mobilization protein n=1 Tax=Porphyromonas levii TaxID=28114 RepID=UPI001B8B5D39|nr:hypothetical protein [Porphyromonas levii]MBR8713603.1 hypothetical protein [Porphyromonas levii]MBR8715691.1 hypothetical protein [Porphyromonas levii]MBR8728170.1 hypothetical protein [Porphyromonas levii]MBR8736538.1 hypothetical protein [Porphyromonas levii]MBR8773574.1 hypothetical protein [Porphyromonas levii]
MKRRNTDKPDGRGATCPRWDRWHIRIPKPEEQQKLIELYRKSGAKTKSDYVRARLLDQPFKVITEDKFSEPYLRELSNILTKLRIIGVSYNEAVKTLNSYHSVATAQRMIHQLERYSAAIIKLLVQAVQLTIAFENHQQTTKSL